MGESNFEGSKVLEKLAEIGKVDEFYDAVDDDDFTKAKSIMVAAGIDANSIEIVLKKMGEYGE